MKKILKSVLTRVSVVTRTYLDPALTSEEKFEVFLNFCPGGRK